MTEETPGKVMTLLGVAVTSMFFLFAVTYTSASFQGSEVPFPDPFAPAKVMAVLDNAASTYSNFVAANLTGPAQADFAYYKDNVDWVIDNSDQQILAIVGLQQLADVNYYQQQQVAAAAVPVPQVAGAYTSKVQSNSQDMDVLNTLFSLLGL